MISGSKARIAVVTNIGPLDKYGYQVYQPILENLAKVAAQIYIASSTPSNSELIEREKNKYENIVLVSNNDTWFKQENGVEIYSAFHLLNVVKKLLDLASRDDMDCALLITINQYIPEENISSLIQCCETMLTEDRPFEWLYKRIQLGGQLFETDRRVPFIVNLRSAKRCEIVMDGIRNPVTGEIHRNELGNFREKKNVSTVDVPREMTLCELEELRCFIRNYDEINPNVNPTFDWEKDKWIEINKYSHKTFSSDPLSPTGEAIARASKPDYVSQLILRQHPQTLQKYYQCKGFSPKQYHIGAEHPTLENFVLQFTKEMTRLHIMEIGFQSAGFAVPVILANEKHPDFTYLGIDSGEYESAVDGGVISAYLEGYNVKCNCEFVKADSGSYLKKMPYRTYDLILIDHYKPLYFRDFYTIALRKLVSPNGCVLFHDVLGRAKSVWEQCKKICIAFGFKWEIVDSVPGGLAIVSYGQKSGFANMLKKMFARSSLYLQRF